MDRLGPNSDFFEQSGPKKVRIDHQKSEFVDENNVQILVALKNCYIEGKLIVFMILVQTLLLAHLLSFDFRLMVKSYFLD